MMFGKKEEECTCKRCSHRWYRSLKSPRKVGGIEMTGARMQATGSRVSLFGKSSAAELHYQHLLSLVEERHRWQHCPNCGTESFATTKVKIQ